MGQIDSGSKSNRLLASRRYTHNTFNTAQESFTNVLDLRSEEIYTRAHLIPSSSLPHSGSSQKMAVFSKNGQNVTKYWYRHKLTKSNTNNEVWFFLNPTGSDDGVGAQLINDNQQTSFISPKYSTSALANATTEDATPGYLALVYKSTATNTSSLSSGDIVSTNDYQFDYKTGVLQFRSSTVDPTDSQYLYMSVYQYVGQNLRTGLEIEGPFTASNMSFGGDVTGSSTSTGSFGLYQFGAGGITITDVSGLTGIPSSEGFISSSAQLASNISGSFINGFGHSGKISGSATTTGSFGKVNVNSQISANASQVTGLTLSTDTVSGSAQIASQVSGSFNKGFEFSGDISGSATSTGSFGRLNFNDPISATDVSGITGHEAGHVSGSSVIASQISASFQGGFEFEGTISGSSASALKVQSLNLAGTTAFANSELSKNWDTALIRSATYGENLSSAISGAFQSGFSYQGTISGSATSTGSFSRIQSQELFVKEMSGERKPISGSMNHAVYASGSFKTDTHGRLSIPVRGKIFNSINTRQFTASGSMKDQKYRTQPGQLFVDNWGRLNMTVQTGSMVPVAAAWSTPTPTSLSGRFGGIASKSTTAGAGSAPGNAWKQYDGISVKTIPGAGTNDYGWTTGIQIAGDGVDDMITFSNGFPADYDTMVWNGSAWYKVQKTPINVYASVVLTQGTQNDSGFIGGQYSGTHGCTLINWNGTSFHNTGQALITGRYYANGSGTTNAGLVTGGAESASPYPSSTCTEEWNGTTWATGGALGRAQHGGAAGGTQNATTYYSGYPNAYTEEYNGTAWSTGPDGPNATTQGGGSGGAGNMMQSPGLGGSAGIHIFETAYVTGSADTYNGFSQNPTGRYLLTKKLQANLSPGCVGGGSTSSEDGYGGGY